MQVEERPAPEVRQSTAIATGIAYVAAFVVVELIGHAAPLVGAVCEGLLMLALVNHYAMTERTNPQPVLLALAVVCLYRLLALTPVQGNDPIVGHAILVGVPVLIATALALRLARSPLAAGVRPPRYAGGGWAQYLIALSGIPLSYAAYKVFKPAETIVITGAHAAPRSEILGGILALAVFSGLLEELLFRGLAHEGARTTFGASGLYVSAAIFGAAYIGSGSLEIVAFVVAAGAFFGWCYERTQSVIGVALAHALISIGVVMVWPSIGTNLTHLHL